MCGRIYVWVKSCPNVLESFWWVRDSLYVQEKKINKIKWEKVVKCSPFFIRENKKIKWKCCARIAEWILSLYWRTRANPCWGKFCSEPFPYFSSDEFCVFWNSAGFSSNGTVKDFPLNFPACSENDFQSSLVDLNKFEDLYWYWRCSLKAWNNIFSSTKFYVIEIVGKEKWVKKKPEWKR